MSKKSKKFYAKNLTARAVIVLLGLVVLFFLGRKDVQSGRPRQVSIYTAANSQVPKAFEKLPLSSPVKSVVWPVPVLMYHHIGNTPENADSIRQDLTVNKVDFNEQMAYLQKNGYESVTAEQLYLAEIGRFKLPSQPVVITFDDGYDDNFLNAIPILQAHGMKGVFAIITQFVGTPGYGTWQQVKEARDKGMEIASHSQHHLDFTDPKYTLTDKEKEISGSIKDIQEHLGFTPVTFIYPYGHNDMTTEKILAENDIKIAFTTQFGFVPQQAVDLLKLPRVRVHGSENMELFGKILNYNSKPKVVPAKTSPQKDISKIRSKPAKSL